MLFILVDSGARAELPVHWHPLGLGGLEKASGAGEVSWLPVSLGSLVGQSPPVFCLGGADLDNQAMSLDLRINRWHDS